MNGNRRAINSARIAREVGVSRSTVSKVINDYPNISEETRQRVWAAIEKLGYTPDLSARIMAGKGTDTFAFFLAGSGRFAGDILVDVMIASMIESAAEAGYHILTYIVRNPDDTETMRSIKEVFYQRRADAGVFVGFRDDYAVTRQLVDDGIAIGMFDHSTKGAVYPNRAIANFDDERVSRAAIDYLVELGHRRIAVINGDPKRNAGLARGTGFANALAEHGLAPEPSWIAHSDFSRQGGKHITEKILAARRHRPTAIAAVNDSVAFGAIDAIHEAGLRVPGDVSVIGIDGHPLGEYVTPKLTTFAFDFGAMFRSLIMALALIVEGESPLHELHQVFTGVFTRRDSCAAPRS